MMKKLLPIAGLLSRNLLKSPLLSANYLRACSSAALKPAVVKNAPISLHIEPTTACNLRCTTCDRTHASDLNLGTMSFNVFKEILDQFNYLMGSHHVQTGLLLTGLGEPFLNKDIFRMIEYAKEKGISYVHTISNGTVLNNEAIIQSGLDHISFSMDGATKETFESIRVGAKYEKVVSSLKDLISRRKVGKLPFIDLNITLQGKNRNELNSVVDLAAEIGADRVSARILNSDFAHDSLQALGESSENIKTTSEYARAKNVEFRYADNDTDPCVYPWIWPYVTWNGYVVPCCYKSDPRKFNFGNILEESFESIWNGEKYRQFRKALTSENPPDMCKNCPKCPTKKSGSDKVELKILD
ncbi:SPASM domain-containing protein [Gimesia sp.]|uniref:radical SAM protein n=1 Tax=Gimesia sp. TaxID=2024833 RepID=UPI003A937DFD